MRFVLYHNCSCPVAVFCFYLNRHALIPLPQSYLRSNFYRTVYELSRVRLFDMSVGCNLNVF